MSSMPDEASIQLEAPIPIGRNAREYQLMFNISGMREGASYLDCGAGPSSFNAEMTAAGRTVVSTDPLYKFSAAEFASRIHDSFDGIMKQVEANRDLFRWETFESPEQLKVSRRETIQRFMVDYEEGKKEERYVAAALPQLPFDDKIFDVALCSHLLFLYSEVMDEEFHLNAILEMMRVAREARIFPICDLNGQMSPHLKGLIKTLRVLHFHTQIINVPYEFQKGVNQCLLIRKKISQ